MGEMRRLQDEQASGAWQGYEDFRRRELRVWAATMLDTAGLPVGGDQELDEFVAEINANVVPRYVPTPGAVEALTRLRQLGLRLYVTSGASSEYTTLCLGQAGLAGHFDAILGPDRVSVLKSGVAFYRGCLGKAEVEPDQACAVDDSVGPLDWALNAGCYAVGVGAAASLLPPRERFSAIDNLGELDRAVILLKQ
jgi:phosphoglycolate phosphatase-like HAD superfamily hydrolase